MKKKHFILAFTLSALFAFASCGGNEQKADPEAMARDWCKCKKEKAADHADCLKIANDAKEEFEEDSEAQKKILKILRECD